MSDLLCWLIDLYVLVLILHVVFSWVPRPPQPLVGVIRLVRSLVEPVVAPLRRIIPPLQAGGAAFDLSIIVVFLGCSLLRTIVCR